MDITQIYKDSNALLEGHFKLSSGKHSGFYLQSAKVLELPSRATALAQELAKIIKEDGIEIDTVCSPALGGLIAGYALAQALDVRFIFAERVDGDMTIRRGFEVSKGEKVLICEDIITTGGSALEAAKQVELLGGDVVGYSALANRGFCSRKGSSNEKKPECKLPVGLPLFALEDFEFEVYDEQDCPMCKDKAKYGEAYKPGSRGN
jgi:orotate phosphoribosyltransferase